jgi:hypothetical protein
VVFLVGDTQALKKFTVHDDIVKASSEFVRLALRGDWKEASSRQIPLPDDEPAVFSVYQHWLYNGLIHSVRRGLGFVAESDEEYELLVKAYIFGETGVQKLRCRRHHREGEPVRLQHKTD